MRYRVRADWPFKYRGHAPGEEFIAELEPDVEARALSKGAIEVLDSSRESVAKVKTTAPKEEKSGGSADSA